MKRQPIGHRVVAAFLAVVALHATVVPPLLDASEHPHGTRVESEHDPGACQRLHDHAACTQLMKSLGNDSSGWVGVDDEFVVLRGERVPPRVSLSQRSFSDIASPRAPPAPHS